MTTHVDYYFSLTSPWSYLGHERLLKIIADTGATVTPYEVSFRKTIFSKTGGLPVHKRAPQRQAYRLQELARWRDYLGVELNVHPRHWPNDETMAANMVVVLRETVSTGAALKFAGLIMRGVWAEDKDITDPDTLIKIGSVAGIDASAIMREADNPEWAALRQSDTDTAIDKGVFGAPSYCVQEQIYWGQDRLDFVDRHLRNHT